MSSLPPFRFPGATALVTGAASGMGEQMAHELARRGTDLILLDRDADRLADVARAIESASPARSVDVVVADLSDLDALGVVIDGVIERHERIDLLINNAGIAFGGSFEQLTAKDFDSVMTINFHAPVDITRRLLPTMRRSTGAHIVNVSSLFGIVAPPGQSAYSSSKFAIRGFTECLRHELAPTIGVTSVHPGGIKTRIAETAGSAAGATDKEIADGKATFAKLLTYPADKAALRILDGVEKRKGRVLIAASAHAVDILARVFPSAYYAVMRRGM
ncbi:SDR family NAD(P)-dependent oxidoreductase [Rhodococcus sp. BP-316]|uniref:SDR family NAD(P)-dependent oxidoreductase n=1 Tax=Rhodococcus sp. BP-316 TaxID=2739445 RepID=UPI001C9AB4EA|nr:SDR family NAD(P)-dependent oxidoreductase [Rhodococcus sp. BP-316]MBY6679494.1 SDR family NAD(P)-dependent oxidoreductase [Rhodococcus sp. BP-316]